MPRPPQDDAAATVLAKSIIANSTCADEVRAAQAFLLPLLGYTLNQTAEIVGKDRFWVSRTRNKFVRAEPIKNAHGGRRNAYLSPEQERAVVRDALAEYEVLYFRAGQSRETDVRGLVSRRLEILLKRTVNESTITEILDRYASKLVPGAKWSDCKLNHSDFARLAELELRLPHIRERSAIVRARGKSVIAA